MEIVPKYSISTVLIIMTVYFVFSHQDGWSPLHAAVINNNVQMVRFLIQNGAKTNLPHKVNLLNKLQMCMIIKI